MAKNKYSVVIPLYNKKETICRALNSVIAQNHEVEIIVVDDGSTDGGGELVRSLKDLDLRLIRQSNQGVSAARNKGIFQSSYNLIAFLDADDEWHPNFLSTIDQLIESYPHAGAYATSFQINNGETIIQMAHPKLKHPFIGIIDNFEGVRFANFFCSSSIVVRKEAITKIGGFDISLIYGEDTDAWGRLAFNEQYAFSSDICVNYYLDSSNHAIYQKPLQTIHFIEAACGYLEKNTDTIPEHKYHAIVQYVNLITYDTALRNIWSGNPSYARNIVRKYYRGKFSYRAVYCWIISFLPKYIIQRAKPIWSKIVND